MGPWMLFVGAGCLYLALLLAVTAYDMGKDD